RLSRRGRGDPARADRADCPAVAEGRSRRVTGSRAAPRRRTHDVGPEHRGAVVGPVPSEAQGDACLSASSRRVTGRVVAITGKTCRGAHGSLARLPPQEAFLCPHRQTKAVIARSPPHVIVARRARTRALPHHSG